MTPGPSNAPIPADQKIDPITASVIQGALENIAIEMGYKLMRMSYSSIIRESEDFGAALIDMQNRQLAEAKQSTPLQSGPIPGYIRGLRRRLPNAANIEPGDVFMHNDPYSGATHGPDVAFVVPAFHRGRADRLCGHDRSPPRHRRAHARQRRHRRCHRLLRRRPAFPSHQGLRSRQAKPASMAHAARQYPAPDLVVGDMDAQIAAARIGASAMSN